MTDFLREYSLLRSSSFGVATSDCSLHCGHVTADGALWLGGQTLFAQTDEGRYVALRALRPHYDAPYEGLVVGTADGWPLLVRSAPRGLSIQEASGYEDRDEKARVAAGAALTLQWQLHDEGGDSSGSSSGGVLDAGNGSAFAWRVVNAATGAEVLSGTVTQAASGSGDARQWQAQVPALSAGSYVAWVALQGVAQAFTWPFDYRQVTGEGETLPARYAWTHPALGALYYDPRYNIGALPYNATDATQKALLDARAALVASGKTLDRAPWAGDLITFYADGTQDRSGGEFAALKIIAGTGDWIGDANVHLDATAGACLWRDASGDGTLSPVVVSPLLRAVFCLEELGGALWLGGMASTRDGRAPCVVRLDESFQAAFMATGVLPQPDGANALSASEAVRGLAFDGQTIIAQTLLGAMRLDESGDLVPLDASGADASGGRVLATCETLCGDTLSLYSELGDVLDADAKTSLQGANNLRALAFNAMDASTRALALRQGTAKDVESALAPREAFYGVLCHTGKDTVRPQDESGDAVEDDFQLLSVRRGGNWEHLSAWKPATWDMGRIVACGEFVLSFGFNRLRSPRLLRLRGDSELTQGLDFPMHVLWGKEVVNPDVASQDAACLLIGRKWNVAREVAGSCAALYTGHPARVVFTAVVPSDPDVPVTQFCALRTDLLAAGFNAAAFPAYLVFNASVGGFVSQDTAPLVGALCLQRADSDLTVCYVVPDGMTLPLDLRRYTKLQFEEGVCHTTGASAPPAPPCGKMDIAVVMDVSSSMAGVIESVKAELEDIAATIRAASGTDYRLALLTTSIETHVNATFALDNAEAFGGAVTALQTSSGFTPYMDACLAVLNARLATPENFQQGDFGTALRPDARRAIIVISDDAPSPAAASYSGTEPFVVDESGLAQVASVASAQGVRVTTVYVPSGNAIAPASQVVPLMTQLCDATGGLFLMAQPSGKGAGQAITDLIATCGGDVPAPPLKECTDPIVRLLSADDSAADAIATMSDPRLHIFTMETAGAMHAVHFDATGSAGAIEAQMQQKQVMWLLLDEAWMPSTPRGSALTTDEKAKLAQFDVALPTLQRDFWLPRKTRAVTLAVVLDGVSLPMDGFVFAAAA